MDRRGWKGAVTAACIRAVQIGFAGGGARGGADYRRKSGPPRRGLRVLSQSPCGIKRALRIGVMT